MKKESLTKMNGHKMSCHGVSFQGWGAHKHPQDSPDKEPGDFHLFPAPKENFSGHKFTDGREAFLG